MSAGAQAILEAGHELGGLGRGQRHAAGPFGKAQSVGNRRKRTDIVQTFHHDYFLIGNSIVQNDGIIN